MSKYIVLYNGKADNNTGLENAKKLSENETLFRS